MIDARKELQLLVRSRYPFVAIHSADEARVEALLDAVAREEDLPLFIWSSTRGMRRSGALIASNRGRTLDDALNEAKARSAEALYFFKDLQAHLQQPHAVRRLLDLTAFFTADRRTLALAGVDLELPPALRHHCATLRLPLPSDEELKRLAWRVVHDFSHGRDVEVALTSDAFLRLIESLKGLTHLEAERALCRAVADDLKLDEEDVEAVLRIKKQVLQEGGVLEYVAADNDLDGVGGLEGLKAWLRVRRDALTPKARDFGLPAPKGVILLGVQGCGKSLAAKATAAEWNMPLLRLEAGRIYDKYVGESDKNLERALDAAEHMAPCILMIDEIEKAFAYGRSAESDGGLSQRIFGRLLTWLQDRTAPVFLIATCNDVQQLPPELMRKGRFDEVFFVDLPGREERRAIFEVHLASRERDAESFDLDALADATDGYSGAEIEQAVVAGLYAAFAHGDELTTAGILAEIGATQPLSVTRREEIEALRAWAEGRTVPAAGAGS